MLFIAMRRIATASIVSALALSAASTQSQPASAVSPTSIEFLLQACKSPDLGSHAYCLGQINGAAAVMELVGLRATGTVRQQLGMCVATPFPSGDAEVQAFVNWANANPPLWGQNAAAGIMMALTTSWPCS